MDLKLPALGEGADSGTVVNVFAKEGDTLAAGQPVLELENEKAIASIPASAAGKVTRVYVKVGDKLSVGQRMVAVEAAGEVSQGAKPPPEEKSGGRQAQAAPEPSQTEAAQENEPLPEAKPGLTPAAAPSIRKMARDLGIDLTRVRGSARGGRIVLEDVRAYIQSLQRLAFQPRHGSAPAPARPEPVDFAKWGPISRQPLSPLRQVISRRMVESWNAVPRVTQFDEADITSLNALRKTHAAAYEKKGTRLTLTAFVLKALVTTLRKHRVLNSSLDETANEIVYKDYYHLGIAVDTDAGLIVPVLRDADKKSLFELSKALEELATKARERKISGEELKGGTFTVSNQGGIGGGHFTPIVNRPEVAILGLGRGAMKAVVRGEKIEPRLVLPLALSYDHRVIDGGAAARFMVDFVKALEHWEGSAAPE